MSSTEETHNSDENYSNNDTNDERLSETLEHQNPSTSNATQNASSSREALQASASSDSELDENICNGLPFNQEKKVVFSDENLDVTCTQLKFKRLKKFCLTG